MRLALAASFWHFPYSDPLERTKLFPAEGQRGDSGANQLSEGIAAYQRGDYSAAMRLLRPLADEGMYPAQSGLCVMYANGKGALQDYAQAATWCRKAADQGDEGAVHPRHDVLEGRR
jgi:TPR repeat protein